MPQAPFSLQLECTKEDCSNEKATLFCKCMIEPCLFQHIHPVHQKSIRQLSLAFKPINVHARRACLCTTFTPLHQSITRPNTHIRVYPPGSWLSS